MAEPASINVLRSPSGAAFPPTQRSAEIIRRTHGDLAVPKTTAVHNQSPNSTSRRLQFTASPSPQGIIRNQQDQQENHRTHGNNNGTRQQETESDRNQNGTGTGTGTGNGRERNGTGTGTAKAFKRPAFLNTAGSSRAISMDRIIELTVSTYRCPARLRNASKNIVSFHDRVAWTMEKHKALDEAITSDSRSEDLKQEIGDYFCMFGSRNECETEAETNDAAAVATILTISNISPAIKILVQKALLYGVGLSLDRLRESAEDLDAGKQLGGRTAAMDDLENTEYMGLLELITASVCQMDSEAGGVICAIRNLFRMDCSECERMIDALAVERRLWEAAHRELGEKPMATYLRFENFKENIEQQTQFSSAMEAFEFITTHRQDIRLSKIQEWEGIEKLFIEAAVIAGRQEASRRLEADDGSSSGSNSSGQQISAHPCSLPFTGVPRSGFTGRELTPIFGGKRQRTKGDNGDWLTERARNMEKLRGEVDKLEEEGKDMELTCKDCTKTFTHSIEQQIRFKSRGWTNLPGKCSGCTDKGLQDTPRPCFGFDTTGTCRFGDTCKFVHGGDGKTSSHNISMQQDEQSNGEDYSEEYLSDSESSEEYLSDHY